MSEACNFETMRFEGTADFFGINSVPRPYIAVDPVAMCYDVHFNVAFSRDENVKVKVVIPSLSGEVSRQVGFLEAMKQGDPITVEGSAASETDRSVVPKRITHLNTEIYNHNIHGYKSCF